MGRIDDEKIRSVRDRIDIVDVIGRYLPLKKSGANFQGLCPFHQEKTPSFNVNSPRQIFHCFGCGVGGDVFKFLMRVEGLSFPEAVRRLGEQVGIDIVEEELTPEELKTRDQRATLYRINQTACDLYASLLIEAPEGGAGRRYLRQRGYDGQAVRTFNLGFAPDAWTTLVQHLVQNSFQPTDIQQTGLTRPGKTGRGDYDLFRNRLLFPIHDLQGRVVAFGGRVLDDSLPKYMNSPESPIYHKGEILYGLHQAKDAMRQSGEVLVVEGYFDVLALHRAGFANCLATCGTALTAEHARLLKRFADKVLLVFDQDSAGRQATFRAMDALLPGGLEIVVVDMPTGADPDSLIMERGAAGFQTCLDSARPVLEVFLDQQLQQQDASIEGRVRAAEEVLLRIRRLPNDLQRALYVRRLAELTDLDQALLQSKSGETPAPGSASAARYHSPPGPVEPARPQPTPVSRGQLFLLRLMLLDDPKIRQKVREVGTQHLFLDPRCRGLADYLLAHTEQQGQRVEDLLCNHLNEEQHALLSGLLLQEGHETWQESAEQIFEDCRRAAHHSLLKIRLRELDHEEQTARTGQDQKALDACLQERLRVNSELKKKV